VENITRSIAFQCAGLKPGVTGGAEAPSLRRATDGRGEARNNLP